MHLANFLQDNVNNYMLQGARGLLVHESASGCACWARIQLLNLDTPGYAPD